MRKRGVPINPHKREAGEYVGDLHMYNYGDPVLHRNVSRVDLVMPNQPGGRKDPLLPGLHDVTLGSDRLMLTGFERLPVDGRRQADYAQSWWVLLRTR
jgi:hypothetical protein